jgi:hypothetical protein
MPEQCPDDHHHLSAFSANAWMFPDGNGAKKKAIQKMVSLEHQRAAEE